MKKRVILLLMVVLIILCSCGKKICSISPSKLTNDKLEYGVFLGANNDKLDTLLKYNKVCIELEEFSKSSVERLKSNNTAIYAYLSVGSLEKYKDYYADYEKYTFMNYENWSNERWIDVSKAAWQNKLIELATELKYLGADGLFLDNYDVYYIACEEYECSDEFKDGIYNGLKLVTKIFYEMNLKLIINSGTDFLMKLFESDKTYLNYFEGYNQETVFSRIIDYDNDSFGNQQKDEQSYYFDMINLMKEHGKEVYLLEYTKNDKLKKKIADYCEKNDVSYYISERVNLDSEYEYEVKK